jgi:hypothetical protein
MSDVAVVPAPAPAAEPVHRIFTATLVIGVSGSGKTSLAETFAMYLWETYKRILLLYSWDGGAIPTGVQKRMRQGLIRFWRARTRSASQLPLETLALGSKGYWPQVINPATGETAPSVRLIAPVTTRYTMYCPKGHVLKMVPAASLIVPTICPVCKPATMIQKADMTITEAATRTKGFENVGGVFFDGLTSMCDVVMDEMDSLRGHGHIGGEKSSFGGTITSGDVKYGGNNRADVGFSQGRARQYVGNSLTIPYLMEGPVFTGLAQEATDEGGLTIVSLKLPGSAAAEAAPAWFGNVMEMSKVLDDAGKEHFAIYLRPFTDKNGKRHLLKTSSSPFGVPDVLIDPPVGDKQPFTNANLGNVFKLLDEDLTAALLEDMPGVPGLEAIEYGEATAAAIEPVAAASGTPPVTGGQPVSAPVAAKAPAAVSAAAAAPRPATAVPPRAAGAPPSAAAAAARPAAAPKAPVAVPASTATAAPAAVATPAATGAPKPSAPPVAAAGPAKVVSPPPPGRPPARAPGA